MSHSASAMDTTARPRPSLGHDQRRRPGVQAHACVTGREGADGALGSVSCSLHLLSGRSQVWPSHPPFPFCHSPSPTCHATLPLLHLSPPTASPPPSPGLGTPCSRRTSTRPPRRRRTRPPCTARSSRAQARHPGPHTTGSASAGRGSCPPHHASHMRHSRLRTCADRRPPRPHHTRRFPSPRVSRSARGNTLLDMLFRMAFSFLTNRRRSGRHLAAHPKRDTPCSLPRPLSRPTRPSHRHAAAVWVACAMNCVKMSSPFTRLAAACRSPPTASSPHSAISLPPRLTFCTRQYTSRHALSHGALSSA